MKNVWRERISDGGSLVNLTEIQGAFLKSFRPQQGFNAPIEQIAQHITRFIGARHLAPSTRK